MGSTMTSLVQLAFGVMDIDAWLRRMETALASARTNATLAEADVHSVAGESPFLFVVAR